MGDFNPILSGLLGDNPIVDASASVTLIKISPAKAGEILVELWKPGARTPSARTIPVGEWADLKKVYESTAAERGSVLEVRYPLVALRAVSSAKSRGKRIFTTKFRWMNLLAGNGFPAIDISGVGQDKDDTVAEEMAYKAKNDSDFRYFKAVKVVNLTPEALEASYGTEG